MIYDYKYDFILFNMANLILNYKLQLFHFQLFSLFLTLHNNTTRCIIIDNEIIFYTSTKNFMRIDWML